MKALRQVTICPFLAVLITFVTLVAKASAAPVLRSMAIIPPESVTKIIKDAFPLREGII